MSTYALFGLQRAFDVLFVSLFMLGLLFAPGKRVVTKGVG